MQLPVKVVAVQVHDCARTAPLSSTNAVPASMWERFCNSYWLSPFVLP